MGYGKVRYAGVPSLITHHSSLELGELALRQRDESVIDLLVDHDAFAPKLRALAGRALARQADLVHARQAWRGLHFRKHRAHVALEVLERQHQVGPDRHDEITV